MVNGHLVFVPIDADAVANSGLSTLLDELATRGAVNSVVASTADAPGELVDDAGRDLVFSAPWNHRGTVTASVALSGDSSGEYWLPTLPAGVALTTSAHQWLIRDPEPLASGLSGGGYQQRWSISYQS